MTEQDGEKADAIGSIRDALDTIQEAFGELDAWQRHYLQQAFEHLANGKYGEAITFTEDAITPMQERNEVNFADTTKQMSVAQMRRDLDAFEAGGSS